jgi:hypothetical protein
MARIRYTDFLRIKLALDFLIRLLTESLQVQFPYRLLRIAYKLLCHHEAIHLTRSRTWNRSRTTPASKKAQSGAILPAATSG